MLKLYERPPMNGRPALWWTQRNKNGICFKIRERMNGEYAIIVNEEKRFAICKSFKKAEKRLREAEKIYENQFA